MDNQTISVVIRTMPTREAFLDKCLFILSGQTHHNIEPIVVAQQLNVEDSLEKIQAIVEKWRDFFPKIHFLYHTASHDARARSLNLGMNYAHGRYLAFLDDDDKLYPHHYAQLIEGLATSQFAWAYSDVMQANYNADGQLIARLPTFKRDAYSFVQHLKGNFIPIHAFVMDRQRVSPDVGQINEALDRNEDYDFLIRLAFKHQPLYIADFSAEYCFHGKNTNMLANAQLAIQIATQKDVWANSEKYIHQLKEERFGWWINEIIHSPHASQNVVQAQQNELNHQNENVSAHARNKLNVIYQSYTWKMIRFGKKINWAIRRKPKKRDIVPENEQLANQELHKIMFSGAWLLFGPLFLLEKLFRRLLKKN